MLGVIKEHDPGNDVGENTRQLQGTHGACGNALDAVARVRAPRRPHADARLRADARGAMAAFAKSGGTERRGASRAGNSATVASPGPAPETIIARSSSRLAIRPRWIVHRCYSGPWRPRRGRHHRDLDRACERLVVPRQVRAVAASMKAFAKSWRRES
jgi:hypothetical protein